MMKKKVWNIRRLVNDSLGPSSQRTSVVYCKLTDFTSRLRFAIAAVCGGGLRRRRRQRCTLAKNHHLAKLSRLRHCQMRKEIDLPSGPWHRQPLRYTQFMVHAFKTESVNRYYILLYIPNPNLTHPIVRVSVNYLNKLVQENPCQKLLFLHQLTHNMTKDCSLHYKFNT